MCFSDRDNGFFKYFEQKTVIEKSWSLARVLKNVLNSVEML